MDSESYWSIDKFVGFPPQYFIFLLHCTATQLLMLYFCCVLLQLVFFSDKTTQGLAADNSDLREQLERVRGQLVEARNAAKTTTLAAVTSQSHEEEREKREDNSNDSSEAGKMDVYKAQIKDLNKRLAQLQEVQ